MKDQVLTCMFISTCCCSNILTLCGSHEILSLIQLQASWQQHTPGRPMPGNLAPLLAKVYLLQLIQRRQHGPLRVLLVICLVKSAKRKQEKQRPTRRTCWQRRTAWRRWTALILLHIMLHGRMHADNNLLRLKAYCLPPLSTQHLSLLRAAWVWFVSLSLTHPRRVRRNQDEL